MSETDVEIAGRRYRLAGDPDDPYFAALPAIVDGQAALQAWVRNNLPKDAVVMDAGGNIGVTALLLSGLLPDGNVHVFEALPANAAFLRRNVEINGIANCTVNSVALGDRLGSIAMQGAGSASHVAMNRTTLETAAGGTIPMITLDDYVRERCLDRIDFMKMDVEGFEPAVLEGASSLVERFRPPILMEFNSWCLTYVQGFHARDFVEALWHAFDVTSIGRDGREVPAGDGSAARFLHDNVVLHGTIEDVLLRLKPEARVPAKGVAYRAPPDPGLLREIERLEAELAAVRAARSWRLAAALRRLARAIRRQARVLNRQAGPRPRDGSAVS